MALHVNKYGMKSEMTEQSKKNIPLILDNGSNI